MMKAVAFALATVASAQHAHPFPFYSATAANNAAPSVLTTLPEMDIEAEIALADKETAGTKVFVVGKVNEVNVDFFELADKVKMVNGTLYSASWRIENALSIAIHFDEFIIPEGGAVFVVGDTRVLGAWTHKSRWSEGNFMTRHVEGNQVTVQYFESAKTTAKPIIHLETVTGTFRELGANAGTCNIQAICAESGNPCNPGCSVTDRSCSIQCTHLNQDDSQAQWAGQSWAREEEMGVVVMATQAGSRFCSGSFINNALGRPLVLTAAHCGVSGTALIHKYWRDPVCQSNDNRAGDHEVAGDLNVISSMSQSDVTLLEVRDADLSDGIYLAGWDATSTPSDITNVVGLHHPSASNMKISHGGSVSLSRWSGTGASTHWRLEAWTEATTEPGSSGSPLYSRESKRIIGQLHGGSAACPAYNGFDVYGGVFYSLANDAQIAAALTGGEAITFMDGAPYVPSAANSTM